MYTYAQPSCDVQFSGSSHQISIRHGTHINQAWHTYEWVMAHIRMSHGAHVNANSLLHTHLLHVIARPLSHGTHTNESWHTYEWVVALMWIGHVTHVNTNSLLHTNFLHTYMNQSCRTFEYKLSSAYALPSQLYESVMSHIWIQTLFCIRTSFIIIWIGHVAHVNTNSLLHTQFLHVAHVNTNSLLHTHFLNTYVNRSCRTFEYELSSAYALPSCDGQAP